MKTRTTKNFAIDYIQIILFLEIQTFYNMCQILFLVCVCVGEQTTGVSAISVYIPRSAPLNKYLI